MLFFFFNDTATTEIYTLSLHDALPIYPIRRDLVVAIHLYVQRRVEFAQALHQIVGEGVVVVDKKDRSEEHTSELQSHLNIVCRLLLEKKKTLSCMAAAIPHVIRFDKSL